MSTSIDVNEFEKYLHRKFPEYVNLVTDQAVLATVSWKLGQITEQERNETWDTLLISEKDRKLLVKCSDLCDPQKNRG